MDKQKLQTILQRLNKIELRAHQIKPIQSIIEGISTMCIFPTAAGKSLIYQVSTLYLEKITIIITPLISLQQDQIQILANCKLPTGRITEFYQNIPQKEGFLFATPELLQQQHCLEFIKQIQKKIAFFVIDECHLITEWGNTFRKAYKQLSVLNQFNKPILALTASVTSLQAKKILNTLELQNPKIFFTDFNRKNIHYSIHFTDNKFNILKEIIQKFNENNNENDSILIYAPTRTETDAIQSSLSQYMDISSYHAGLSIEQRQDVLSSWIKNISRIIVCTTAFSLGIDKASVGLIIHFGLPKSTEQFYQESGRGGRNGKQAFSVILTSSDDVKFTLSNVQKSNVNENIYSFYWLLKICYSSSCRRLNLLSYFKSGHNTQKQENCCDYCDFIGQKQQFMNQIFGFKKKEIIEQESVENQLRYYYIDQPSLKQLCGESDEQIIEVKKDVYDFKELIDVLTLKLNCAKDKIQEEINKIILYLVKKSNQKYYLQEKISQKLISIIKQKPSVNDNLVMREILKASM